MSNIQRARRIPNADGQILIENWVEERATEHLDHRLEQQDKNQPTSPSTTKKNSHTALLTQNFEAPLDNVTTYRQYYYQFGPFEQKEQGARRKRLEHELTRQVTSELNAQKREYDENLRQERIVDSNSEYRTQYSKEFESKPPPATQPHDLLHEMPVSFWTEHRHTNHGVTQLKTFNSPFHRNATFSTPVELTHEGARPHEMENWPNYAQKSLNDAKIC
ncbi:unnamed protein product [Rotaria sordida]|uniref:Uncharacterized protein n=1 Tax=Rotaria sordida TaxID=392033 RepID=A0A818QH87_9BILA|nr:unnamed protein product [Rotaria sordida]CAF0726554.1 unnamed protein product [Rotaria sordida]CAF0732330.1 unnamed protein product [Rotaria sordida]CAF0732508.1 unnamed protein product [Rotaria sordida]CAF0757626.1 unnamed protein product [Rotaria sordida]